MTPSHGPDNARVLLPRRGGRLRRISGLLPRVPETGPSYYDPLFERPDLVEDDYYRVRNQPCG